MKRFWAFFLTLFLLVSSLAFFVSAAEPILPRIRLQSLDITITSNQTLKIGEQSSYRDSYLDGLNVSFTSGSKDTALTYCPRKAGDMYGSEFYLVPGYGNNGYLTAQNTLSGVLRFECYLTDGQHFDESTAKNPPAITINGIAREPAGDNYDRAIKLENTWETRTMPDGQTLYRYILSIPFSTPWNLPEKPVYRFHIVDNPALHESSNLDLMPLYAEAGASVSLRPNLNAIGQYDSVTGYFVNGQEYSEAANITMPAEDVYIDAIINGGKTDQTVINDLKINLNFNNDIYYGRVLPTDADLKKALSFSTTTKNAGLYLDMADVTYLFDDSLGEAMDPWVGNTWISFIIRCKEGFSFANTSIWEPDETVQWMNDNVNVTINGKRNYFGSTEGDVYYDGYFAASYMLSGIDGVEIHIRWYGGKALNIDTSGYRPGDTVTISDGSFNYDGYVPYRYDYTYTAPNGEPRREQVTGNTFTYPQTNGTPIVIYAIYVRGEDSTTTQAITKDAGEKISLDTGNANFPSGTIVSANLIQRNETGGTATIEHVKTALAGHATDCLVFDITASSFNQTVQPDGTVLIRFPVPAGYDSDYIDFCYVAKDGTVEKIPIQIENGQCIAVLEHFSLYAIAKTVNKTEHQAHTHATTKVIAKTPGCTEDGNTEYYTCTCGKWFSDAAATREISDHQSVRLPAAHTDANGDQVCDLCGTGDGVQTPTEPEGTVPSTDHTAPSDAAPESGNEAPKSDGGNSIIWIVVIVAVALAAVAVTVILILKRKND